MREKKKEPVKVVECDESGGKEASVASEYRMDCRLKQGDQGGVWKAWAMEWKGREDFPRKSVRPDQ